MTKKIDLTLTYDELSDILEVLEERSMKLERSYLIT